ncbi:MULTISPECIES: sulfatase [Mumia]|uniref:Sulfatase n=1 Tax=Mumia xiangluensis TaxID=1678900 RepID=A0ABW1QID2_9ACTN|nr:MULTISPECIES: sulfatase [Mumia]
MIAAPVAIALCAGLLTAQPVHSVEAPAPAPQALAPQARTTTQPNIVLVLADDLGWADTSTGRSSLGARSSFNDTPAIGRLAREGTSFDNAYAAPNCAPTRAALLTGAYAQRPQNNIYAVSDLNRGRGRTLLVGPKQGINNDEVLPASAVTVAETARRAGYATGYAGKFHVTKTPRQITAVHGFDESWGGSRAGHATVYHAENGRFNARISPSLDRFAADYTQEYVDERIKPYANGTSYAAIDDLVGTSKHVTDAVADATIDFIARKKAQPFFAVMAEYAVHEPVDDAQARKDLLGKYRRKPAGSKRNRRAYAAMTEGLDQTVARLTHYLETTPDPRRPGHDLADNTVVIFTSDNGGRTDRGASNGPLRGQKSEMTEGGVRVPWIVWSANPKLVRPGRVNHSPINGTDLHPTVAALAGVRLPRGVTLRDALAGSSSSGQAIDGTSLVGAFRTGKRITLPRFVHFPGYMRGGSRDQRPQSFIRQGRWKLVYSYETQSWQLYDLRRDIGERRNLAQRRPKVTLRLGKRLIRWLDRTNAPLATVRKGKRPIKVRVRGWAYANGKVKRYRRAKTITVRPRAEMPVVLRRVR